MLRGAGSGGKGTQDSPAKELGDRPRSPWTAADLWTFTAVLALPQLPNELLALIVMHLTSDTTDAEGPGESEEDIDLTLATTLSRCCLVNKTMLAAARARLYEKVLIEFSPCEEENRGVEGVDEDVPNEVTQSEGSTWRAFSLVLSPHLALYTRIINLNVDFRQPDCVSEHAPGLALATALRLASNVSELNLVTTLGEDSQIYITPLYAAIIHFKPPLRRILIEWGHFPGGTRPTCPSLFPLLASLPLLEELCIDQVHIPPLPPSFAIRFHLNHFTFLGITGAASEAFSAITFLSSQSLDHVVIDGTVTHDLAPFTSLNAFHVILANLEDPATMEEDAQRMAREHISQTLMTASPSLAEVEIFLGDEFPRDAFNAQFFRDFPRTVRRFM